MQMKRIFASSVNGTVDAAEKPEIFLLEIDDSFRVYLFECWRAVQKLENEFGKKFESATFICNGIWSDNEMLFEKLLVNKDFVWLDEMPQVRNIDDVQGERMKIFPSGNISFEAYDKKSGKEYESAFVSIEDFISDFQPLVLT